MERTRNCPSGTGYTPWLRCLSSGILLMVAPVAFAGAVYGQLTRDGAPQSASIQFTEKRGEQFNTNSGADGRYEVVLPPGNYEITSDSGQVAPDEVIVFHEPKRQDLRLQ